MTDTDRTPWPLVSEPLAWLENYFELMRQAQAGEGVPDAIVDMRDLVCACSSGGGKLMFAGNGASASIASHCAVDFTKQARVRAVSFNDANLITCYGNDYGYEHWIEQAVAHHSSPGDVLVLISSSGTSANVVNAARYAHGQGLAVATCTGCDADNPLRSVGGVNLWVNSHSYNIIECTHMFWLMAVCDLIVGKAEYAMPKR